MKTARSRRNRALCSVALLIVATMSILWAGCLGPVRGLYPAAPGAPTRSVYLVRHDWHTGIVVRRADIPPGVWSESHHHPSARYLEVGWGDRDFYQADDPSFGVTCKAAFWPTPSVLQVVGFQEPLTRFYADSELLEVRLSIEGHRRVCEFIANTYARTAEGATERLKPSLYGEGRFYAAKGKFHIFRTCNSWSARALRAGGCPVTPAYAQTAANVLWQTRKFGKRMEPADDPDHIDFVGRE